MTGLFRSGTGLREEAAVTRTVPQAAQHLICVAGLALFAVGSIEMLILMLMGVP